MHNWVEISRPALRRNLAAMRARLAPATGVCAVVKADAYGHGAVECARVFAAEGVDWFAVTSVAEGARLRQGGIRGRILVLAGFARDEAAALLELGLTPAVWDAAQVAWLAAALGGGRAAIHVKLDTGMGRLGATPEQEPALAAALARAPGLEVEAIFSHLSSAEAPDETPSREQWRRFEAAAGRHGQRPFHLVNSAGASRFPHWGGMMARLGLCLYGYGDGDAGAALTPALEWKARVVAVKQLPAGHGVGYGMRFRTSRPMRVATVSAGYADGYRRDLSPGAALLLGGRKAAVLGAISMDLTTVDADALPGLQLGDEATLIGRQGEAAISAADLAAAAATIPYEILCGISARVERRYLD